MLIFRKVGGIYTVLTSKSLVTVREWGDRYALIGPYVHSSAISEFEHLEPSPISAAVIDAMQERHGITVYFGRWFCLWLC